MPTPLENDQAALIERGKDGLRRILDAMVLDPEQREHAEAQINKFGTLNATHDPEEDTVVLISEENGDSNPTHVKFQEMFDAIAAAMAAAASEKDESIASSAAKTFEMEETSPTRPIGEAWITKANGLALWFQWHSYDQSQAFSIQKDRTVMSLELRDGDKILQRASESFEE